MTKNEAILELIKVIQNNVKPKTAGEHEYISILMHEAEGLTKQGFTAADFGIIKEDCDD